MKTTGPTLGHKVHYEREVIEMPSPNGWRERIPGAGARAWCTCGQLDTGFVDAAQATAAAREHVALYLPGTPFDGASPVRPDEDGPPCRRCGKPTGKWWLIDAGADAEHRMLCSTCDAAEEQRALGLPVRPDEEPTT